MRFLDIDLDFFLSDIALFRSDTGERLGSDYIPWDEKAVRAFLEGRCGLSLEKKIKGKVITHHDEAFLIWREMYLDSRIKEPFEVVHIDAHADLGLGDSGFVEIMTELLHSEVENRCYPTRLGCGNYLAYAIACRWINKLVYVPHQNWREFSDIPWFHMKNYDDHSGALQLKKYLRGVDVGNLRRLSPLSLEPEVPFEIITMDNYREQENFDYLILAQSPGYTPIEADRLMTVIQEYMVIED